MSIHDEEVAVADEDYEGLGLTDEELAAIKPEAENDDVEAEAVDPDAEDADPAVEEPEGDDEEEGDPEAEAEVPVKADVDTTFAPRFESGSTEGLEERLAEFTAKYDTASDALAAQYERGDISFSEFRRQDRAMQAEFDNAQRETNEAILRASIALEHSQQSADQKWALEQNLFFQDNEGYKTDPILRGALSAQLEYLYADEANSGKSGLWFLREAGKAIDARFERAPIAEQNTELKEATDKQRKKAAKPVDAPRTLADIPSAEANNDAGEFAAIDKLQGLDYERAISRMSEDQYDRFMSN